MLIRYKTLLLLSMVNSAIGNLGKNCSDTHSELYLDLILDIAVENQAECNKILLLPKGTVCSVE